MNKSVFQTRHDRKVDTINAAGGVAYKLEDKEALATMVCTGTFNNTFYASGKSQLDDLIAVARRCPSDFLADVAVYARNRGFMKDSPAVLMAILAGRAKHDELSAEILEDIFPLVIDNGKMLRNFVQAVRSGVFGRKSLGSLPKRLIRDWLASRSDVQLMQDSIGNDPSLADIIKMVHPSHRNIYAWIIGKSDRHGIPDNKIPWLYLTNQEDVDWSSFYDRMGWHALRMNLNSLKRHGVLDDSRAVKLIANKLSNAALIRKSRVFPYQLLTTYLNVKNDMPRHIVDAIHDALEISVDNVPVFNTEPIIAVDSSGSMGQPVTGFIHNASVTTCNQVGALIASAMLRVNGGRVIEFDTRAREVKLEPRDSILTNASRIAKNGGGTSVSCSLRYANQHKMKSNLFVIVSDNESWCDRGWGATDKTATMKEWATFKGNNPHAKLVLIDLVAGQSAQADTKRSDILYVSGFSDAVFDSISAFVENRENFVDFLQKEVKNLICE